MTHSRASGESAGSVADFEPQERQVSKNLARITVLVAVGLVQLDVPAAGVIVGQIAPCGVAG